MRVDPHVLLDRTLSEGGKVVPFVNAEAAWSGDILGGPARWSPPSAPAPPIPTINPPPSSFL